MNHFTYYDLKTGEILYLVSTPDNAYERIDVLPEGVGRIRGEYERSAHYVKGGFVKARPELALGYPPQMLADGEDEWVCTGVPNGSKVIWPDLLSTIETDGDIRFTTNVAGTHRFIIELWPYKTQEATVEAINA